MMNKKRRPQTTLRLSHVHYSSREREPRPGTDDAAVRPRGRSRARGPVPPRIHPPGVEIARARRLGEARPPPQPVPSWGSILGGASTLRGLDVAGAARHQTARARPCFRPRSRTGGGGGEPTIPPPRGGWGCGRD